MMETSRASEVQTQLARASGFTDVEGPTGADRAIRYDLIGTETGFGYGPAESPRVQPSVLRVPPRDGNGRAPEQSLLRKAQGIVDSVEPGAEIDMQLYLDALKGTLIELWESVIDCSETHQDVLAILENGVRQAAEIGDVTSGQLAAFREALNDLGQAMLVRRNADVVRSEFVRQGFTPLSFVNDLDITQENA